jgi:hypothetical protein
VFKKFSFGEDPGGGSLIVNLSKIIDKRTDNHNNVLKRVIDHVIQKKIVCRLNLRIWNNGELRRSRIATWNRIHCIFNEVTVSWKSMSQNDVSLSKHKLNMW